MRNSSQWVNCAWRTPHNASTALEEHHAFKACSIISSFIFILLQYCNADFKQLFLVRQTGFPHNTQMFSLKLFNNTHYFHLSDETIQLYPLLSSYFSWWNYSTIPITFIWFFFSFYSLWWNYSTIPITFILMRKRGSIVRQNMSIMYTSTCSAGNYLSIPITYTKKRMSLVSKQRSVMHIIKYTHYFNLSDKERANSQAQHVHAYTCLALKYNNYTLHIHLLGTTHFPLQIH